MKRSVAVATETDELGPCEPGTNVHFDGIVWQETKEGMLILNVSWRGRTYVGALMDATNHAWAPPRLKPLNAKSKSSLSNSLDTIGNNIGERKLRNGKVTYKVNGLSTSAITTTATATSDNGKATNSCHGSAATSFPATGADSNSSPAATPAESMPNGTSHGQQAASGAQSKSLLLQCTEIGCFKKFKGTDGLEYHRNFAHNNNSKALPPPSHLAPSSLVSASNYSETSHNFGGTANETCLQPSHATTMTAATAATSESSASHSLLSEVSISNGQLKHAKYDINEMVASHSHQPFYQPLSTSATATSVARSSPVVGAATSTNVSKSESSSPAKKVNVIKIGKQQQQQHQQMQATANGQAKHGPYTSSSSSSSSSSSISEQSKERPHQPSSKANNKSKSSLSGNSKTFTNGNVSHHSPSDTTTQQQQQQRQQQQQQQKLPLSMSAATSAAIAAASRGALSSH